MTIVQTTQRRDDAERYLLGRINYEQVKTIPYSKRTLKLERMEELYQRLGQPAVDVPMIHIAGTKGKGSTSAMLAAILTAAGKRTGVFSSPHLHQIEERFCVDGLPCSGEELARYVDRLRPIAETMDQESKLGGPTYFELTTAIAFLHFEAKKVDAAILEVGLGGRLDSTNICKPVLTIITSISFDHTQQLGNTLALIAKEKAGILKQGVPLVSGVCPPEPRDTIATIAEERRAELFQQGTDFRFEIMASKNASANGEAGEMRIEFFRKFKKYESIPNLPLTLHGDHQAANASLAVAAAKVLVNSGWDIPIVAMQKGLATVQLPARVEIVQKHPKVIIDAAHNVASAKALADFLKQTEVHGKRTLLFAATLGKDVPGILKVLLPHFDAVVFTQYRSSPRAFPLDRLRLLVEKLAIEFDLPAARKADFALNPCDAWRIATEKIAAEDLLCVTGSFFIASEIRPWALELR